MKRYIYAMSRPKSKVAADLEQGTRQLIMHLIKLYLYNESDSVNHWRKEVAEKLNETDRLKSTNKYPSAEFILDSTWRLHKDLFHNYLQDIIKDYGQPDFNYDESLMKNKIRRYFEWVAEHLSNQGYVSYTDIKNYLRDRGF